MYSPILVQETDHPCAMSLWFAFLRNPASFCNFPRVVVSSDWVYSPETCLRSPSLFLKPLPPELLDHPLCLIVVDVLSEVTQLRVAEVVELLRERGRSWRGGRGGCWRLGREDAVLAQSVVAA